MVSESPPWLRLEDGLPVLRTPRMVLRIAQSGEAMKIVRYLEKNREHLQPWEPLRDDYYFTQAAWEGAPERDQAEAREGSAYRFRLIAVDQVDADAPYVGTISLRGIVPFPGYNATLGYSLDREYEGFGLMREAVQAVIRFGFEELNLRRIEACFIPANTRSEKLLTALGFQIEGLLRSSLEVNGKWEDHRICSLINLNWRRP
jgi:[ribosomal protein S5]-alanine N-acetyltransferase